MNNTNNMAKLSRGNSKEVPESRNFAPSAVNSKEVPESRNFAPSAVSPCLQKARQQNKNSITTSWVGNCGCTCLCPNPPK